MSNSWVHLKGILQSDQYGAYASRERKTEGILRVGCWAHARRKFHEAIEERPKAANVVLHFISRLYQLERGWGEAKVGGQRADLRREHFARPLRWLRNVVAGLEKQALPASQHGKACLYPLNHWDVLAAHQHHACTRLDNNLVENAIRPSAIGKQNWLFIGHPNAGQRSAIIHSLVVSCQHHGKDSLAYLRDVLRRLPAMINQDDLTPLTPAGWLPSQLSQLRPGPLRSSHSYDLVNVRPEALRRTHTLTRCLRLRGTRPHA